ncbi:unnamed protein product [Nesidiocoris tenuis]|uniref:Amino acid transporter transmembrane domain-containing protein n=1 Tax=Nesidiocoris tenuis TaxID=355587 RepID=A0A6H5H229_9HEMI|nr:unnamed protein product [Nesidiocoris tenuis]
MEQTGSGPIAPESAKPPRVMKKRVKRRNEMEGEGSAPQIGQSRMSVATLDAYDPYEYRVGQGHLTNCQAWVHFIKCSFGTGVLTMPMGFKHAGLIPGFILGIIIGGFCIYCMQLLIKNMVHISARERKPYIPFNDTMKYTFSHGYPMCQKMAGCAKPFTDFILAAYHFGICITYVNYMSQTSLAVVGKQESSEGYNLETIASTACWVIPLCAINSIRNLKYLAPVSLVGNVITAISMAIILYYIFEPSEHGFVSDDWEYVGAISTIPVYIGIILFAVEAFGVIIAVEKDMINPKAFGGFFGVFDQAMFIVLAWYLFLGCAGYLRYGSQVHSSISFTIPFGTWPAVTMYILLCLTLFCSYPLHCFVVIDIIWTSKILPKVTKRPLLWEMVFRWSAVVVSAVGAVIIPELDLLISLIGSICLSVLGIIMPAVMDYNVAWSKYGMEWSFSMVKSMLIVVLGICAFFVGTYGCVYRMVTTSLGNSTAKSSEESFAYQEDEIPEDY